MQCGNIAFANLIRHSEIGVTAPREFFTTVFGNDYIGKQTRVAAIAIWKKVSFYQPIMENNSQFSDAVGVVLQPISGIIQQLAKFGPNEGIINADIFVGFPVLPCPFPDMAIHALMKV